MLGDATRSLSTWIGLRRNGKRLGLSITSLMFLELMPGFPGFAGKIEFLRGKANLLLNHLPVARADLEVAAPQDSLRRLTSDPLKSRRASFLQATGKVCLPATTFYLIRRFLIAHVALSLESLLKNPKTSAPSKRLIPDFGRREAWAACCGPPRVYFSEPPAAAGSMFTVRPEGSFADR
jgi:hypothetical protein